MEPTATEELIREVDEVFVKAFRKHRFRNVTLPMLLILGAVAGLFCYLIYLLLNAGATGGFTA